MQIFHLSLSLSISRLHTHTPSFLQTGLGAILQGLQRESQRKASSFLPSLPRISKPFVYLEPPFHYLETARFFFLSQQTFRLDEDGRGSTGNREERRARPSRSRFSPSFWLFVHPSSWSTVKIFAVNRDWLRFSFYHSFDDKRKGRIWNNDGLRFNPRMF